MNLLAISVCQSLFCCPDLCRVNLFQKWVWILESYTWKGPKEMARSRLSKLWKVIRYAIQDWSHAFVHLFLTYWLSLYSFPSINVGVGICQRTRQNAHLLLLLFKYLTFFFRTIMRIQIFSTLFYLFLNWYFHTSIHILISFTIIFVCWTIWIFLT